MPNADAVTEVSLDDGSEGAKSSGGHSVVVNAMDVNRAFSPAEESHVGSGNATIGAPVDQSAVRMRVACSSSIHDTTSSMGDGVSGPMRLRVVRASEGRGTIVLTTRPAIPD